VGWGIKGFIPETTKIFDYLWVVVCALRGTAVWIYVLLVVQNIIIECYIEVLIYVIMN